MTILTDTQRVTGTIKPINSQGNAAEIDGVPQWSTSNPTVATVTPSEDGKTCVVTAVGLGTTQIGVVCDADMDDEIREITTLDDVEVKASEAVSVGIEWGTPEEQGGEPPVEARRKR
jgi:hypothetical protein